MGTAILSGDKKSQFATVGGETYELPTDPKELQRALDALPPNERTALRTQLEVSGAEEEMMAGVRTPVIGGEEGFEFPTRDDAKVMAARYGIPIAGALASRNPSFLFTTGALGELTALELEEYLDQPNYKSDLEFIQKKASNILTGTLTGAADYGSERLISNVMHWLGRGLTRLPKELPKEIGTAQKTLGDLSDPAQSVPRDSRVGRVLERIGLLEPEPKVYSLTKGQLSHEEQNFTSWLESTVRSSIGGAKKRMRQYDLRNEEQLENLIKSFIRSYQVKGGSPAIGKAVSDALQGELKFVKTMRGFLYDQARSLREGTGATANLTRLKGFFNENMAREEVESIHRSIKDLLPEGGKGDWGSVPVDNAIQMMRRLNKGYERLKGPERGVVDNIRRHINGPVSGALSPYPEAKAMFGLAQSYFGETAQRLENKVMTTVIKNLRQSPEVITQMMKSPRRFSLFKQLEETFTKTGVAPSVATGPEIGPTGKAIVTKAQVSMPSSLTKQQFEELVRRPLRYALIANVIDEQTDRVSGPLLGNILKRLDTNDIPFAKEVFGESGQFLKDLATTLTMIQRQTSGDKIFIQLMQGGYMMQAMQQAMQAGGPRPGAIASLGKGAIGLFLTPLGLTKLLGDPRAIRGITDGLRAGPGSSQFARISGILTGIEASNRFDFRKMSQEAVDFYSTMDKDKALPIAEPMEDEE